MFQMRGGSGSDRPPTADHPGTEDRLSAQRSPREAIMTGFRLGSVFGVEIRIDYSWFVIFFLVLWTLTRSVFPAELPGGEPQAYLIMGLAGALLMFASLLGHELAHSFVARRFGLEVSGITLFIFGGMAGTTTDFRTPREEFTVAVAGPIASFAIAALFHLAAVAGAAAGLPATVTTVAAYLAMINLVLAAFNLFPGFPLDGGRILRSLIWHVTGDALRATRAATQGGTAFGLILVVLGVMNLFGGNVVGGLWLILVGWFVRTLANASFTQHELHSTLGGIRVRDVMTPHPHTVAAELTLQQFVQTHVLDGVHHSYPVLRGGTTLGLITLPLVRAVPQREWSDRTVAQTMLAAGPEITTGPEDELPEALAKLVRSPAGRLLVLHDGRLLGILAHSDVSRCLEKERLRRQLGPAAGTALAQPEAGQPRRAAAAREAAAATAPGPG
jgi:Zn-dependent protease/CBS domain-containing protein